MRTEPFITAAFVGFAGGLRSTTALGAFVFERFSTTRYALATNTATVAAIVGESVVDKLPTTPSRLAMPGLVVRVVAGGLGAYALTRHNDAGTVAATTLLGSAAALAGSYAGASYRSAASKRVPPIAAALAEDVAANALTYVAESRVGLVPGR